MSGVMPGRGTFRAILWKEFREALPWGAVAFVIVSAALEYVVRAFTGDGGWEGHVNTIMSMYPVTMWGGPFVGVLIGLAQILPEHRGDRWGFLTHRPVGRTMLFAGKATVGALLYLLAYGIPLAATVWWTAAPGHIAAPFDARMAQPAIADLAGGLVYYFVALLVGMREARWYGSRGIALLMAVGCTMAVMGADALWEALLVCAVGASVAGIAAWGTFVGGGWYAPQPRLGRVTVGLATLLVVGPAYIGVVETIAGHVSAVHAPAAAAKQEIEYTVTTEGTLVQTIMDPTDWSVADVRDLQGRPIPQYHDSVSWRHVRSPSGIISSLVSLRPDPDGGSQGDYRAWRPSFRELSDAGGAHWYYLYGQRLVVGYDAVTAQRIGWVGPSGFTTGRALPTDRFPGPLQGGSAHEWDESRGPFGVSIDFTSYRNPLLAFSHAVYRLDLAGRRVDMVFAPTAGDSVLSAESVGEGLGSTGDPTAGGTRPDMHVDAVATTKSLYLFLAGAPAVAVPSDSSVAGYGEVRVSRATLAPGAPTFLRYSANNGARPYEKWKRLPDYVTELGANGAVIGRFTLAPADTSLRVAGVVAEPAAPPIVWRRLVREALAVGPGVSIGSWVLLLLLSHIHVAMISVEVAPLTRDLGIVWALMSVVGFLSVGVALGLGRTFAFPPRKRWVWAAVAFVFGVSGLLLMLAVVEWPRRERCPACRRKRVVTRERCEHCNAPFALPSADGTEIGIAVRASKDLNGPLPTPNGSSSRGPVHVSDWPMLPESTVARGTGIFRAIFWKEFREAAKWGAAGFVVVVCTTVSALGILTDQRGGSILTHYSAIALASALVALLLGVAQAMPESRGDRWGFLAHRPVSRTTLFWGKALAGLVWYLVAAGMPLAYGIAWNAQPGHLALPFDPAMALAGITNLIAGVVYYFAGIMVGVRDARWYGTRLLVIGAALICSNQVATVPSFWQALVVCAVGIVVVGSSAWGAFVAGGEREAQPRLGRLSVGLTDAAGTVAVVFPPLAFVAVLSMMHPPRGDASAALSTSYEITTDGEIAQVVRNHRWAGQIAAVNDVAGRPMQRFPDSASWSSGRLSAGVLSLEVPLGSKPGVSWDSHESPFEPFDDPQGPPPAYRSEATFFQFLQACSMSGPDVNCDQDFGSDRLTWYYVHRERLIAAYDSRSARLVGWLGPAGFTAGTSPPSERFPGPRIVDVINYGDDRLTIPLIGFRTAVYRLDLRQRTAQRIFAPSAGDSVLFVGSASASLTGGQQPHFDVIATTKQISVLAPDAPPLVILRDAAHPSEEVKVSRAQLAPGAPTFLWSGDTVTKYGSDGAAIAQVALPPLSDDSPLQPSGWASPPWDAVSPVRQAQMLFAGLNGGLWPLGWLLNPPMLGPPESPSLSPTPRHRTIAWIAVIVIAVSWAAVAYALSRGQALWWLRALVALAVGPLGILLTRALGDSTLRENCPSCGRARVVTRERCEHCGAPFAAPPSNGTEICHSAPVIGALTSR